MVKIEPNFKLFLGLNIFNVGIMGNKHVSKQVLISLHLYSTSSWFTVCFLWDLAPTCLSDAKLKWASAFDLSEGKKAQLRWWDY